MVTKESPGFRDELVILMRGAIVPCRLRSPSGVDATRCSVTWVSGTTMVEAMSSRTSKIDRVTIAISLLFDGTATKTMLNSLVSGSRPRTFVTLRTACRTAAEWVRRDTRVRAEEDTAERQ